jgi:hypothetical protein
MCEPQRTDAEGGDERKDDRQRKDPGVVICTAGKLSMSTTPAVGPQA